MNEIDDFHRSLLSSQSYTPEELGNRDRHTQNMEALRLVTAAIHDLTAELRAERTEPLKLPTQRPPEETPDENQP